MFYKYKIKIINNEEVLYLYIDNKYEFAKEFSKGKTKNKKLNESINAFIKKNQIIFNGIKVFLVINGVVIASLLTQSLNPGTKQSPSASHLTPIIKENIDNLKNTFVSKDHNVEIADEYITISTEKKEKTDGAQNKNSVADQIANSDDKPSSNKEETPSSQIVTKTEESTQQNNNNNNEMMITIHRSNGSVIEMTLNDYLIGVVSAEMPASFNLEALKAQALVARTYTLRLIKEGRKLTDSTSTQAYYDNDQLKKNWGSSYTTYYTKIKNAVMNTTNEVVVYNNNYIDAVYHSTSNGRTSDSVDVWGNNIPYLKSVDSKWDINASSYLRSEQKNFDVINLFLRESINNFSQVEVISRTSNNSTKELKIDGITYSGLEVRKLFNLRSTDFDIEINDNGFLFTTRGYGHGVGMSQYGANGMASEGYNYEQIIKHYYTGVIIKKI